MTTTSGSSESQTTTSQDLSDDDDEVYTIMSPASSHSNVGGGPAAARRGTNNVPLVTQHAVVVSGEAPESDDETFPGSTSGVHTGGSMCQGEDRQRRRSSDADLKADKIRIDDRPKYNSLLHKKLRERNISLHKNISELVCHPYISATKELSSISQQLIHSQMLVQEVSSTLRRLTNELFQLEDAVEMIRGCKLLPDIAVDVKSNEDA